MYKPSFAQQVPGSRRSGFTLIELLLVISIISLLTTIMAVTVSTARKKARNAIRMSDIQAIDTAIQLYIDANRHAPYVGIFNEDYGGAPTITDAGSGLWQTLANELKPYMAKFPTDPCGVRCPLVIPGGAPWFSYAYRTPAEMAYICDMIGCGKPHSAFKEEYSIYAEAMEITYTPWGFPQGSTFGASQF